MIKIILNTKQLFLTQCKEFKYLVYVLEYRGWSYLQLPIAISDQVAELGCLFFNGFGSSTHYPAVLDYHLFYSSPFIKPTLYILGILGLIIIFTYSLFVI